MRGAEMRSLVVEVFLLLLLLLLLLLSLCCCEETERDEVTGEVYYVKKGVCLWSHGED